MVIVMEVLNISNFHLQNQRKALENTSEVRMDMVPSENQ